MNGVWRRRFSHVVVFAVAAVAMAAQAGDNADIYGTWKIRGVLGAADVSGLSTGQLRKLIGKPVLISAAQFAFNGRTCKHPSYARSVDETASHFRREWRADASQLPLAKTVTVVDAECNYLYLIRADHIIVAEAGNFLEAVRVKR